MKKLILGMVFVFGILSVDATTVINIDIQGCLADAWRYGTEEGGGDPESEYFYMNLYYELFCEPE